MDVVALGVLAILAACKGEESALPKSAPTATASPSAPAPPTRNVCALLTAAQIESAIGTPVVKTVPYGEIECRWSVKPLAALPDADEPWVDVQLAHNEAQMTDAESAPANKGVVAIAGLGDRAFRTNDKHHLWVKRGKDVFIVRSRLHKVGHQDEAARGAIDDAEMRLARLVLEHL